MHLNYTSHLFKQVSNFKSLSYTSPPYTISPEITAFCFINEQYSSITAPRGELLRHATLVSKTSFTSSTWKYQELYQSKETALRCLGTHVSLSLPSAVSCCSCLHSKQSSVFHTKQGTCTNQKKFSTEHDKSTKSKKYQM